MKILLDHKSLSTPITLPLLCKKAITGGLIGVFLLPMAACNQNNQTAPSPPAEEEVIKERLILDNATLNQVDKNGNNIWQLEVKRVVYRQNNQNAALEGVKGKFYQEGNVVLKIEANQGKIINDGEEVNLAGKVVATDPRNGAVLKSEIITWLPKDNRLVMPQKITGENSRFTATADQGKYNTDRERLELTGNVEGTSQEPPLNLTGEQLTWQVAAEIVTSNQPLQVEHYDPETEKMRDRATANSGSVNLAQKIVSLKNNVNFKATDPPLEATGNAVTWNIDSNLVRSPQPLKLFHRKDKMRLSGNQGEIDLDTEIAKFEGNVQGISEANQATLAANRLNWNLATQEIKAQGNVVYQQRNPPLTSHGEQANGVLQEEDILVRGRQGEQVKTEFVP